MTMPTFARVEIRLGNKLDLATASVDLRALANELEFLANSKDCDESAVIIAHHRIRAVSKKLRGTNNEN